MNGDAMEGQPITVSASHAISAKETNSQDVRIRDKTATSTGRKNNLDPQTTTPAVLTAGACFEAERGGFEPPWRFKPPTAFPVLLLQPLGHLSNIQTSIRSHILA